MSAPRGGRGFVALGVAIVGVLAAGATLGWGWWYIHTDDDPWTITGHEYHFTATTEFFAGPKSWTQCEVNNTSMPGFGPICTDTGAAGYWSPYSEPLSPAPALAQLYANLETLVVAAVVLGAAGAGLVGWSAYGRPPPRGTVRAAAGVLLAAAMLAWAGPVALLLEQPSAIAPTHPAAGQLPGSSPANSFFGSCSRTGPDACQAPNASEDWGAGPSWYVALGAGGVFVIGAVLVLRDPVRPRPPTRGSIIPDPASLRTAPEPGPQDGPRDPVGGGARDR